MDYAQMILGSRQGSWWWDRARSRWPRGFKINAVDDGVGALRRLNDGGCGKRAREALLDAP